MSYADIARQLGWADPSGARTAVLRAMDRVVQEPAEEVRVREVERLDGLYQKVLEVLERRHIVVSGNQRHDDLEDDGPTLAAIAHALKIQERRARLLGLDAPQRLSLDAENVGREIAELLADLGRNRQVPDADDQ